MEIADFELERSDPEPVPMRELLALADPETERLWADLRLGYTESAGHPLLRAEIAGAYQTVGPEQVLVCSGAQEGPAPRSPCCRWSMTRAGRSTSTAYEPRCARPPERWW